MNTAQGNVKVTEAALRESARLARAAGIPLVWGAFEEQYSNGVCVLGAYNRMKGPDLALPKDDLKMCDAWDAIEAGFDGEKRGLFPRRWWELGRRLRRSLRPRRARD